MKLVIEIPEEDYIRLRDEGMFGNVTTFKRAVREGVSLEQVPYNDAISRQAMHIELEKWITYGEYKYSNATKYLYDRIDKLPSVTPRPKMGRWEYIQYDKPPIGNWHCSECGRIVFLLNSQKSNETPLYDYCPWCGTRMEEEG